MDELAARYMTLPCPVEGPSDFALWSRWIGDVFDQRRYALLGRELADEADERRIVAWRACVAHWRGDQKKELTVSPEDAVIAALRFLRAAHNAPTYVARASRLLLERAMLDGVTSSDVLYLAAAYAWPLRELDEDFSASAWEYLSHAPWQTDSSALRDFCDVVRTSPTHRDDRTLLALAERRAEALHKGSARELLEAIVALHADAKSPRDISRKDLDKPQKVPATGAALVALARDYVRDDTCDGGHSKALMQFLAAPPAPPKITLPGQKPSITVVVTENDRLAFDACLKTRVWDVGFEECYRESERIQWPEQLDDEIDRARRQHKLHYARRLAESVVVRHLNPPPRFDPRKSHDRLSGAIEVFRQRPVAPGVARCALEHLAALYVRTGMMHDSRARDFLDGVVRNPQSFSTGFAERVGAVEFVRRSDPYLGIREENKKFGAVRNRLDDNGRSAMDQVIAWIDGRTKQPPRDMLRTVTAPHEEEDAGIVIAPATVDAIEAALGACIEHLGNASKRSAATNTAVGLLPTLNQARKLGQEWVATANEAFGVGSYPKGVSMSEQGELGLALVVSTAAAARAVAHFGFDASDFAGRALIADALALGCFDQRPGGLLSYTSSQEIAANRLEINNVTYEETDRVTHLWAHAGVPSHAINREAATHLARLCAIGLGETNRVEFKVSAGTFTRQPVKELVNGVVDAAIHLSARRTLVELSEEMA